MESLPKDVLHYLLEFCHPIDYVSFLKAGRLAHPIRKEQQIRKKEELQQHIRKFCKKYSAFIVRTVFFVLCDSQAKIPNCEEEIIIDSLLETLEDYRRDNPQYWRQAFFHHYNLGNFIFPSPKEIEIFLDFTLQNCSLLDMPKGLVNLTNHPNFHKLVEFTGQNFF